MGLAGPNRQVIKLPIKRNRGYRLNVTGKTLDEQIISFIESLPITAGILAGTKFKLDKWQRNIIKGIYRKDKKGKRIVRQALITMPRKNGKTGLTAALALAHLCGPALEKRGQVYSAAASRDQAAHIYREMRAIIEEVPELRRRIIIRDFNKQLEDTESGSTYFALSADANTKYGFSASFIVYDELAQATDRRLWTALTTSTGGRAEPLIVVISTQSPDSESIMSELVDYGMRVKSGENDPAFYPVIYSAPEDSDPWDEKTWLACNPAIKSGFRDLDEMRAAALQAQRIPAREAEFRLLYLNQRINVQSRFVDMTEWDACAGPAINYDALKGRRCYAGLDLASTTDIAAMVLIFPPLNPEPDPVRAVAGLSMAQSREPFLLAARQADPWFVLPFFWIPEDLSKRTGAEKVQLQNWIARGLITATPGNQIDYDWILKTIEDCRRDFNLRLLAFDDWGSHKLVNDLCKDYGFTTDKKEAEYGRKVELLKVRQGFQSISAPTKELLSFILARRIAHGGHPVLRSMANNASIEVNAVGGIKPVKSTMNSRIDGIYALIMALDAAIVSQANNSSVYDEREIRYL